MNRKAGWAIGFGVVTVIGAIVCPFVPPLGGVMLAVGLGGLATIAVVAIAERAFSKDNWVSNSRIGRFFGSKEARLEYETRKIGKQTEYTRAQTAFINAENNLHIAHENAHPNTKNCPNVKEQIRYKELVKPAGVLTEEEQRNGVKERQWVIVGKHTGRDEHHLARSTWSNGVSNPGTRVGHGK